MLLRRGTIVYADLGEYNGSVQGGIRPYLILQNDVGNKYSTTVFGSPITSKMNKAKLPTHVILGSECGLSKPSMVTMEQIITINKFQIKEVVGSVPEDKMAKVDEAFLISGGLKVAPSRKVCTYSRTCAFA